MVKGIVRGNFGVVTGCVLTFIIALAAKLLSGLPYAGIIGPLVLAILLGMLWRAVLPIPQNFIQGISFSNKKMLRFGIVLLGMRLNLADIYHAGWKVFLIAAINIVFTIIVVYGLCKWLGVGTELGILTACGTAICGAAAVCAISSQVKANEENTAVGAAIVAVLGTVFTLLYTLFYPVLGLSAHGYGIFSGATLHEVAHVIAAADPIGAEAVDLALIVKLTRVALLVPAAVAIGFFLRKKNGETSGRGPASLPIPWFILGFLAVSGMNSLGIIPLASAQYAVTIAYLFIAMGMAGLGLSVEFASFKRLAKKPFMASLAGSILLSVLGYVLVSLFGLNR